MKEFIKYLFAKKYNTNELFLAQHFTFAFNTYQSVRYRIAKQAKRSEITEYLNSCFWDRVPQHIQTAFEENAPFFILLSSDNKILPLSTVENVRKNNSCFTYYNYIARYIGLNELSPSINFADKITKSDLFDLERLLNNEELEK